MEKGLSRIIHDRLIITLAGFLLGSFVASFIRPSFSLAGFVFLLGLIVCGYAYVTLHTDPHFRTLLSVSLFVILFSCGIARYTIKDLHTTDPSLLAQVGRTATLEGVIENDPSTSG